MDNNDLNNQYGNPNQQNQYGYPNQQYNANDQYNANNQYNANGQYNANNQYGNYGQYNANQYGNSGQYGNMGGAPLNKNGQPVPNRFGMKLTFSILEILSCNLISFICGIIGCVFTCKANTAYKENRWNDFMSHAKASAISLWIGLVGVILQVILTIVICVLSFTTFKAILDDPTNIKEYEQFFEDYSDGGNVSDLDDLLNEDNNDDGSYAYNEDVYTELGKYYEFELEGNKIVLPMNASDFLQMGFTLDPSGYDTTVMDPQGSMTVYYNNAQGEYLGAVDIFNPTDVAIEYTQGVITGLTIFNGSDGDVGYKPSVKFMNGFTFDSAEADVIDTIGEYAYGYQSEGSSYYEWHPQSYEETYYDKLEIDYWDNNMECIIIDYSGDLY